MTARLLSLSVRGFGALDDVSVDLSTHAAPLVAVCGANGAGKSTLLECFAALIYRRLPTRGDGTLKSLATSRNACLTGRVQAGDGEVYAIRHLVDGTSGASEVTVTRADGSMVVHSGKVTEFDAWVKSTFPPENVFLASAFAAQGSAQFLGMKAADRKGVLLRVLGIERLERQAERARERARDAKSRVDLAEAGLAPLVRMGADDIDALESEVVSARQVLESAEVDAAKAAEALEAAREADAQATAAEAARAGLAESVEAARSVAAAADAKRTEIATRIANNRKVLEHADGIRAAVVRVSDYTRQIGAAEAARGRWEADSAASRKAIAETRTRLAAVRAELAAIADPSKSIADLEAYTVEELEARLATARAALEDHRMLAARKATGEARARVVALRTGLTRVQAAESLDFAKSTAIATLVDDDSADDAARNLAPVERSYYREQDVTIAERHLSNRTVWYAELVAKRAQREVKAAEVAVLEARIAELEGSIGSDPAPDLESLRASRQRAQELADLAPRVDAAEARIAELIFDEREALKALGAATDALVNAQGALHAHVVPPRSDLNVARAKVTSATTVVTNAQRALAAAEERLANARKASSQADEKRAEHLAATRDAQWWGRLAADVGKDGLQALEIDAAGPALTTLVNDLLESCLGSRFAVTIETQRASADGKRQIEGCDVLVTDTVRGRTDRAETFSGGERVLIGEAVSLALTMLAARRLGSGATLVRDESGAALSPENGRAYVAMLRRAAVLARADRVLFVTHNPDLAALADSRIDL